MRDLGRARRALAEADRNSDEIDRSLWLAKAADYALKGTAVLVGGAAVNLHTRVYRPTDVDMCAYLDEEDRQALRDLGFEQIQGDHFAYTFSDGERWPVEFPGSVVDGEWAPVKLNETEAVEVITLESLIVDRITQATDGTDVTFVEAVRLCFATYDRASWDWIEADIHRRTLLRGGPRLLETYEGVLADVRGLRKSL
ncbi:MAG: hypothetical protein WA726_09025 [Acidimicrobiia bacterium]